MSKTSNEKSSSMSSSLSSVVVRLKNDPDPDKINNEEISFSSIKTEVVSSRSSSSSSSIDNNTIIHVKKEEKEDDNATVWNQNAENNVEGDDDEGISSNTPGIVRSSRVLYINNKSRRKNKLMNKNKTENNTMNHPSRTRPISTSTAMTSLIGRKEIGAGCYHSPLQLRIPKIASMRASRPIVNVNNNNNNNNGRSRLVVLHVRCVKDNRKIPATHLSSEPPKKKMKTINDIRKQSTIDNDSNDSKSDDDNDKDITSSIIKQEIKSDYGDHHQKGDNVEQVEVDDINKDGGNG